MKSTDVAFRFPILGITPDLELWSFPDIETLTSCGSRTLKKSMQTDMDLIDADGRRWVVRSVRRLGRAAPFFPWLIGALTGPPQSRIEQELEPLESVSLRETQERVCKSIETFPDDWGYEDGAVPRLQAKVRSTKTFKAIHELLGLDGFQAY